MVIQPEFRSIETMTIENTHSTFNNGYLCGQRLEQKGYLSHEAMIFESLSRCQLKKHIHVIVYFVNHIAMFELSLGPLAPSHVQAEMPDNKTTTGVKSFIFSSN